MNNISQNIRLDANSKTEFTALKLTKWVDILEAGKTLKNGG